MSEDKKMCEKKVNRWSNFQECGKVGVDFSSKNEWVCKRHLSFDKRRKKSDDEYNMARDGSESNRERAELAIEILKGYGIKAIVDYSSVFSNIGNSGHTGMITLDPEPLLKLLGYDVELTSIKSYKKDDYK